ncbi:MAG: DUF1992 domain-containing protein [Chloroflexota bacterium]|nr:DUF1992 domain-containing protein [Chloroflexota bacterium]
MDFTNEHEDKHHILSERRIRDALQSGELQTDLGPSRRLDLEDNPHVPEDMRLAFKVMQNSHFRPDWMELGDEIDGDMTAWRQAADRHFATVRDRLDGATRGGGLHRLRDEVTALKLRHHKATAHHAAAIAEINSKIHRYNATVPTAGLLRGTINADEAMRAFADRLPAYLTY